MTYALPPGVAPNAAARGRPRADSTFSSLVGILLPYQPISAFAGCSRKHDRFDGMLRPVLLREGLAALRRYVRLRVGMLPTPIEAAEPRLARAARGAAAARSASRRSAASDPIPYQLDIRWFEYVPCKSATISKANAAKPHSFQNRPEE